MSFKRCWAVFLRYFYVFSKLDQIADMLYWPAIDIFLWGMTSVWLQHHEEGIPRFALALLSGLIYWQVIWRGNYEVAVNLLFEFWDRNLVNLFSTPLRLVEWIGGVCIVSLFKTVVGICFGALLIYLLYALNVFSVGWQFLPFMAALILSGWWIGFLAGGLVVYYGQRLHMIAFMTAYAFSPFCAIFYPVEALPSWGQPIAWSFPMAYIFEGMRTILAGGSFPGAYCLMAFVLNGVYFLATFLFFSFMFEKSRAKGLARLE